jgi:hypothetical protein
MLLAILKSGLTRRADLAHTNLIIVCYVSWLPLLEANLQLTHPVVKPQLK